MHSAFLFYISVFNLRKETFYWLIVNEYIYPDVTKHKPAELLFIVHVFVMLFKVCLKQFS